VILLRRSIGRLIAILYRQAQIYLNCVLKEFNITSAEYPFLLYLFKKDNATQYEMSSYLYIDKSAAARSIHSLEQKGYVTRSKDETDRRYNRVSITDKARRNEKEIRLRVYRWSELLTEEMDMETADLAYDILERMVNRIETTGFKKETEKMRHG
jgi:DNA-binding MarR family transcriptional regulator